MAICRIPNARSRRKVLLVGGSLPEDAGHFLTDCGYVLEEYSNDGSFEGLELSAVDSIILSQDENRPGLTRRALELYAAKWLDWDVRVYVRIAIGERLGPAAGPMVMNAIRAYGLPSAGPEARRSGPEPPPPFVYVYGVPDAALVPTADTGGKKLAQVIASMPAGPSPSLSLEMQVIDSAGREIVLQPDHALLVRRAFWNCSSVHLRQISAGLSGALVFRAYAELAGGMPGPWPYLYFVKLGGRGQIVEEYEAYMGGAVEYIPFNVGPRLRTDKCGLGSRSGILVSDFVEEAQPLSRTAREGRGVSAIANLFNQTLRAWTRTATPSDRSIADYYGSAFPEHIPDHRKALIQSLIEQVELAELRARFLMCTSSPVLVGYIHGDLHPGNITVRGTDAIVIDYEKVKYAMPIVYDPASLEAGLVVDGFADDPRSLEEIRASLEPLYEVPLGSEASASCPPQDGSAWFYDCVRQIRLHALELERQCGVPRGTRDPVGSQYAGILALVLITKGCKPLPLGSEERSRALAFALGARILEQKHER